MRWLAVLFLAALASSSSSFYGANADVLDLESLRDTLHMLIESGMAITDETMAGVAQAYTGEVRDCLDNLIDVVVSSKSPAEIYAKNQRTDLMVISGFLQKLQQLGSMNQQLGASLMTIIDGPSLTLMRPYLTTNIASISELSSKVQRLVGYLNIMLSSAQPEFIQQVRGVANGLSGYEKTFFSEMADRMVEFEIEEIEADGVEMTLEPHNINSYKNVLDKALNKQLLKAIIENMTSKQAAINYVEALRDRDYQSADMPKLLENLRNSLG